MVESAIKIHQDVNIYVAEIETRMQLSIANRERRQSYLFCVEGSLAGNGVDLISYDALKLWGKEYLTFTALEESHILMVEMAIER